MLGKDVSLSETSVSGKWEKTRSILAASEGAGTDSHSNIKDPSFILWSGKVLNLIICMVVVRCLGGGFGLSDTHICTACPRARLTGPTNSCSECHSSCLLRWLYVRLASRNTLEGRCCGVDGTRRTELRWTKRREIGNAGPPARPFPLSQLGETW